MFRAAGLGVLAGTVATACTLAVGSSLATGLAVRPKSPAALAVASDGSLLIADTGRDQILERRADGTFRVVAGTGRDGFSGDNGPAARARLNRPSGMTVLADGTIIFCDQGNNRVRAISPQGTISTIAGDGRFGWTISGVQALHARLGSPAAVTVGPNKLLYIALGGSNEIVRLNRDGTLTRVAGNQKYGGVYGIGRPALDASAAGPNGLAFAPTGNLFIAGANTKTLLMIDRSRVMRLPAGITGFYPRGDGGIVIAPHGTVIAMDTQRIVRLTPTGEHTIYTFSHRIVAGITGFLPNGIAVSPQGTIYTDTHLGNGWTSGTAIVSLTRENQLEVLWR